MKRTVALASILLLVAALDLRLGVWLAGSLWGLAILAIANASAVIAALLLFLLRIAAAYRPCPHRPPHGVRARGTAAPSAATADESAFEVAQR